MTTAKTNTTRMSRIAGLLLSSAATLALAPSAFAQDAEPAAEEVEADPNEIVVSGTRSTIQGSIEEKRASTQVFDAISADEIGDLPALSIGEALETLTGAGSHRDQGTATEIAIRGLGPFLSSTVINGRVASNGSGDRSVNFSQFPSELFTKVGIYKTQAANQIEGGVAGQIILETLRPLDYGKRRIQGQYKLNYNPDNFEIASDQRLRDYGYRGTLSYVDQFKVGDGAIGLSLGFQRNTATNPEQEAAVSNTLNYCKNDPTDTSSGVFDDGNCNSTRPDVAGTEDFVIAQNSYSFRQNATNDERDAFFGAIQIDANPNVDINLDFQYSNRKFEENRNDLNFSEGRRVDGATDINRLPFDLLLGPNGELLQFTGESSVETNSEYLTREEEYYGGGLAVDLQVSDRAKLSFDGSYSRTQRVEKAVQVRQRIRDQIDIFGNPAGYPLAFESDGSSSNDRIETAYLIRQNGSDTLNFVVQEFDVTDHDVFRNDPRVRNDLEQDRFNSIFALRTDLTYELDGFFSSVESGVRFQELKYRDVPGAANGTSRFENTYSNAALAIANQACRTAFPENGFMDSVSGGNPLITNVDAAGNVIGTTNTYASFDARCLARELEAADPTGGLFFDEDGTPIAPSGDFDSIQNTNVKEFTWAGYLQANFESEIGETPIRGNIGVRAINTKVESTGFRGTLTGVFDAAGALIITEDQNSLVPVTGGGSYTEFLPSFSLVADVQPDLLARFAVFRALSRPDPTALSFGRTFNALVDEDVTSIEEAIGTATATGNPFTSPLLSWNVDAALEWYPNEDSILAVGAYYKSFNGGFDTIGQFETFTVNDQDLQTLVTTIDTTNRNSRIYGVEVTAAHRFTWLPKPLDGFGFKLSYNYANSNFEFQDDTLGAITGVNTDGSTFVSQEALIPPAGIFGLSKHVLSAQAYYEIGKFDFQGIYKYRSRYFQQFVATPGRVRFVDDVGVFEARISYQLNKNVRFTLEGLNLFNEPRTDLRGTEDNFGQISVYGPRYFAGVRFKF